MSGYTNATSGTNQESPGVPAVRKAIICMFIGVVLPSDQVCTSPRPALSP